VAEQAAAAQQGAEKEKKPDQPPPKKSKKGLLIIIAVVLLAVLGGGGFFAYNTFVKGKKAPTEAPAPDKGSEAVENVKKEAGAESGHKEKEPEKKEKGKEEKGKEEKGKEGEGKEGETKEVSLFYPFTQVISTNLKGSPRRVMAQIWVEAVDEEALATIQKNEPYMQSEMVLLLSGKTVDDVTTEEGKEMLLKEMKTRLSKVFEKNLIKKVGFTGISTY
jgi:flagellar protein FliL